ncbi:MAG: SOS response-associated peptidase [Actinomycetes bacterium]
MCGRYVSISTPEQLAERFGVDAVRAEALGERFNVAPTLDVYAVVDRHDERRLGTLRWGFLPAWADSVRARPQPINARAETVATSGMFATAFARNRCILPADGFYEWQDRGEGRRKQPFHVHDPDGAPLAFAGIFTGWHDPAEPDADPVFSCAIVTTAARGVMTEIHDRMPVVLPPALWDAWLSDEPGDATFLARVLTSIEPPALVATPVSERVNAVRNDGPELLEPATVD